VVTAADLIACNGFFSEVITVDGWIILGVVCYTPENCDYPVVIYEDSCCEMTILGLDDIDRIYCGDYSSDGNLPNSCCATSPINNPILYATFQNITGCDCLDNVSVTIAYTGDLWRGGVITCDGCLVTVKIYCEEESDDPYFWGGAVYFGDTQTCVVGRDVSNPTTCSPFYMTFTNFELDNSSCACGCSGMVNITITETI
jgi:hypothetical protein